MKRFTEIFHRRSLFLACIFLLIGVLDMASLVVLAHAPNNKMATAVIVRSLISLVLWAAGMYNLVKDVERDYPQWKVSLAVVVYSLAVVGPIVALIGAISCLQP